jgi:UTP:GlnB (protein PII) uridylyltransferase
MSSGTKAWREGMDNAKIVPLKKPNQIKSQNVTASEKMIAAMIKVARQLSDCAHTMTLRLDKRSASTPPYSENKIEGSIKDKVTQARSIAEDVRLYTNQPRAMICIFMAKEEPRLPTHNQRKLGTASALNMSLLAKSFPYRASIIADCC